MMNLATMILVAASFGVWEDPPSPSEEAKFPEVDLVETSLPESLPVYGRLPPIKLRPHVEINGKTFDTKYFHKYNFYIEWSNSGKRFLIYNKNIDENSLNFN